MLVEKKYLAMEVSTEQRRYMLTSLAMFVIGVVVIVLVVININNPIFMKNLLGNEDCVIAIYIGLFASALMAISGALVLLKEIFPKNFFWIPRLQMVFLCVACLCLVVCSLMLLMSFESRDEEKQKMKESVVKYKTDQSVKDNWDRLQKYLLCCGIEGYQDWDLGNATEIPTSCCVNVTDSEHCNSKKLSNVHAEGCFEQAYELVLANAYVIGMASFIATLAVVFGILILFCYYSNFKRNNVYRKSERGFKQLYPRKRPDKSTARTDVSLARPEVWSHVEMPTQD